MLSIYCLVLAWNDKLNSSHFHFSMLTMELKMTQDELYKQFMAGAGKLGWSAEKEDFPNLSKAGLLPRPENIFKALENISPKKVKYLVLGQDPYPTKTNGVPDATGIAFAVEGNRDTALPYSLRRIMNSIYPNGVGSPDLADWRTTHRVLLLNAALTVKKDCPGSHMAQWRDFTVGIIRQAKRANPDIKLIAWGKDAAGLMTEALNMFTWSHHPAARAGGEKSFTEFWNTSVGAELRSQA
jgi:uracil-DNA glycosylase